MQNNLREYRVKQLMTQKKLGKIAGVSQVTISKIENDLSDPQDITQEKLAQALKIDRKELFPTPQKSGS